MPFGGLLTVGLIGGATSLLGGALGSSAANKAATAQEEASKYATDAQKQSADAALGFQNKVFDQQQANEQPWLNAGTTALGQLSSGTAPGGNLNFTAPTGVTEQNDPGYQFRIQQGLQALQRQQTASGGATGGAAMKEAQRYGQDYASNEYQNVYNRALAGHQQNFNQLSSLAGLGQTAVGQVNSAGTSAANNTANIDMNTGNALAQLATGAGNARGSGYVGSANAYGGALSGIGGNISNLALLSRISGGGGGINNNLSNYLQSSLPSVDSFGNMN